MKKQTAGRDNLGEFAPKFAEINDDVLFGQVWSRGSQLSLKQRSMITISSLIAAGNFEQLKSHLQMGEKTELLKMKFQKSSHICLFMLVGQKHGRRLMWLEKYSNNFLWLRKSIKNKH
ncbi:Gamma-carboxymuconolactone decarboxylase subunit-like protein [Apilactobacillus kunkeei]|nr:Gamma-carboxymuconolactone decarboxylase subunit-like protein [Apilactobacillus kunkeei]CAI2621826.1 hypothetical protein AKUFHON2_01610 [Apilactobacillus kunkeei]